VFSINRIENKFSKKTQLDRQKNVVLLAQKSNFYVFEKVKTKTGEKVFKFTDAHIAHSFSTYLGFLGLKI